VLSGVTTPTLMTEFPYKPDYVFNTVGDIDLTSL
jgi:NagD protein